MNGAFYIGATALHASQTALETVANNVANMNTSAYKRSAIRFAELVSNVAGPNDLMRGELPMSGGLAGVIADGSSTIFSQGDMHASGNPLDIAVNGEGMIELLGTNGQTVLWRGGTLHVSNDGFLAAPNGLQLKSAVSIPSGASNIVITSNGTVSALAAGEAAPRELGRIDLVIAKDPAALTAMGGGYYTINDPAELQSAPAGEDGRGSLVQGSIEASNVQLSDEMTSLILMQRAYGAGAQIVQAGDQLMSIANNLRR